MVLPQNMVIIGFDPSPYYTNQLSPLCYNRVRSFHKFALPAKIGCVNNKRISSPKMYCINDRNQYVILAKTIQSLSRWWFLGHVNPICRDFVNISRLIYCISFYLKPISRGTLMIPETLINPATSLSQIHNE